MSDIATQDLAQLLQTSRGYGPGPFLPSCPPHQKNPAPSVQDPMGLAIVLIPQEALNDEEGIVSMFANVNDNQYSPFCYRQCISPWKVSPSIDVGLHILNALAGYLLPPLLFSHTVPCSILNPLRCLLRRPPRLHPNSVGLVQMGASETAREVLVRSICAAAGHTLMLAQLQYLHLKSWRWSLSLRSVRWRNQTQHSILSKYSLVWRV